MMLIRLLLLLLITFIISSCNYEKYKNTAVSNKGTWWDIYKVNGRILTDPSYSYFCGVNGDCYYYSVKKLPDGSFKRDIDHEHVDLPDTWFMRSDTIQLRGIDYFIHSRTDKKLILMPVNRSNDTLELREATVK